MLYELLLFSAESQILSGGSRWLCAGMVQSHRSSQRTLLSFGAGSAGSSKYVMIFSEI